MKQLEVFLLPPGNNACPLQGYPPPPQKKKQKNKKTKKFHQASLTIHQHLSILLGREMKVMSVLPKNNTISARANSSFLSMKQLEVFLLPPGNNACPLQGYPPPPQKKKQKNKKTKKFHQASLTIHQHLSILLGREMKVMSVLPKNNTISGLNLLPPVSD